ncbi:MAG: DUF5615 family PIN-like protein [Bacteroidota bacterium]
MKFLLDVHMSPSLARLLEEDGHNCRLVAKVADPRLPDIDILILAEENSEVILTHDLDFGKLLAFRGSSSPSVIIFRIDAINAVQFHQLINDNWEQIEPALLKGSIVIMRSDSIRIRKLPI